MVCGNDELSPIQVKMKMFDCPEYSQHFPLGLRIFALNVTECSLITFKLEPSFTKKILDYHFSPESWVKV